MIAFLASPVSVDMEIVVVDDQSTDGSWEILKELASRDSRIRTFRHKNNRGKGAGIRTALEHISGDVVVIQDADLEYDPAEYPLLLQPILDNKADAVFWIAICRPHTQGTLFLAQLDESWPDAVVQHVKRFESDGHGNLLQDGSGRYPETASYQC